MISIVMAYHNRFTQTNFTLKTISQTSYLGEVEVIIVDDFSDNPASLDSLSKDYPALNVKVIKMSELSPSPDVTLNHNRRGRWYYNPCVPYNEGFSQSKGDKIIIQNPECCHVGDILSYVDSYCNDENYLAFHCLALNQNQTKDMQVHLNQQHYIDFGRGAWYNHKAHRPAAYHFTTAITRNNLKKLNGFDERFANGKCFDDDEFIFRVKKLGLRVDFIESPASIHQWHDQYQGRAPIPWQKELFDQIQREYTQPRVNLDKTVL